MIGGGAVVVVVACCIQQTTSTPPLLLFTGLSTVAPVAHENLLRCLAATVGHLVMNRPETVRHRSQSQYLWGTKARLRSYGSRKHTPESSTYDRPEYVGPSLGKRDHVMRDYP